jgi:ABC-type amino acid transport substrate-binding protein
MKLAVKLILVIAVWVLSSPAWSAPKTLFLAVNSPGSPPNLYFNSKRKIYDGVIPDLLRFVAEETDLNVEYVDSHRSRNEYFVINGKFDMFYSSIAWVKNPEKLISTKSIFEHTSYFYAIKPFPENFRVDIKLQKNVCTRRGFVYPDLEKWFSAGNLVRIDSTSHDTMLNMLILGRCDIVELNDKNAAAVFASERFQDTKFYRYKEPVSIVPASLIMNPSLTQERDLLNKFIDKFKASGRYAESLNKHLPTHNLH